MGVRRPLRPLDRSRFSAAGDNTVPPIPATMHPRTLLAALVVLAGCDLVPGPTIPDPIETKPPPAPPAEPAPPAKPAPAAESLTGLGNPFADVYSSRFVPSKANIKDLAIVDGRIYLGHGSTNSHTYVRPVFYDLAAERWGNDDAKIRQEATLGLQVGPSGRLYATSDDAQGVNAVLMIRREHDGSWTQRVVDDSENHSRDTYEWVDPRTGETLVFVQNSAPYFPDVSVSYDGGESFTRYGYDRSKGKVPSLDWYKFFEFKGELYAAGLPNRSAFRGTAPPKRPYLVKYTGDRDKPFKVVTYDRDDVLPGDGTDIRVTEQIAGRIVVASLDFYSGNALKKNRMVKLDVPGRAMDLLRIGNEVYLLGADYSDKTSALYVTRDGRSVEEVATFDHVFTAMEHDGDAFYFSKSGGSEEHSLWRYVRGR